ncbi:MAG: Bax inhibitor-1/YccA family protein [Anaerolineae bacterium]|nr:Bax inhibitor-1/YccA family protein [Anaerolineae bacterium]MCO5204144.1 Bax inhibitor-1/YccA family protein [Anaerolineae bacterium]
MLSQEIPNIQATVSETQVNETVSDVMKRVYGLMTLGLFLTAVVAWGVYNSPTLLNAIFSNSILFFGIIIGQLVLVFAVAAGAWRFPPHIALTLFLVYASINGLMFSTIFFAYTATSIASVFAITAGMFALMSVIGFTTKTDLTKMGTFLLMGLIGILLASFANWFLRNEALYWLISYAGVAIFLGLTAFDTQRIKKMTVALVYNPNGEVETTISRIAISGALSLYLDFINLFLFLLRIFGRN